MYGRPLVALNNLKFALIASKRCPLAVPLGVKITPPFLDTADFQLDTPCPQSTSFGSSKQPNASYSPSTPRHYWTAATAAGPNDDMGFVSAVCSFVCLHLHQVVRTSPIVRNRFQSFPVVVACSCENQRDRDVNFSLTTTQSKRCLVCLHPALHPPATFRERSVNLLTLASSTNAKSRVTLRAFN